MVRVDGNGNAFDVNGNRIAEGVKQQIIITGNVVRMKDAPIRFKFNKVDAAGNTLKGAKLVLRAENGDVIDTWETDGNPHLIEGRLIVGNTYVLEEESAPKGYHKADPIRFVVADTKNVQVITMEDKPTEVKVVKTDEYGKELSGGKFEIVRKDNGEAIVPEFTMSGERMLTGVLESGVTYLLREIEAPSGYGKSSDMEFTVPMTKPNESIIITMMDKKIPTHHTDGGGGSDPITPTVTFHKYDGVTLKSLQGAEFTIYDENGRAWKTVTTDENGYASVSFTAIGKYTYRETKAPAGYAANNAVYELNVTSSMVRTEQVANYTTPPTVYIRKADAQTGAPIEGVRFEVIDTNNKVVYSATTDKNGYIAFIPPQYGVYAVIETKVPSNYNLSDGYIAFNVQPGGVEGETTFYNTRKDTPETPDTPNTPDIPGKPSTPENPPTWQPPKPNKPKTGDYFPFAVFGAMLVAGAAGFIVSRKKRRG